MSIAARLFSTNPELSYYMLDHKDQYILPDHQLHNGELVNILTKFAMGKGILVAQILIALSELNPDNALSFKVRQVYGREQSMVVKNGRSRPLPFFPDIAASVSDVS